MDKFQEVFTTLYQWHGYPRRIREYYKRMGSTVIHSPSLELDFNMASITATSRAPSTGELRASALFASSPYIIRIHWLLE